jgi:hypothetical protein
MSWQLRKLTLAQITELGMTPPEGALTLYSMSRVMPDGQRMATMFWVGENRDSAAYSIREIKRSMRTLTEDHWLPREEVKKP